MPSYTDYCCVVWPLGNLSLAAMKVNTDILIQERIARSIFIVRNQKVLMDSDLAELYGVETKRLNEQVKRNLERFPEDFMFQLTEEEWENLKSQFATSSESSLYKESNTWGGRRNRPFMFSEQGVAMLSSVLNSSTAIQVNISIMRVFVSMRAWAMNYDAMLEKINELSAHQSAHNEQIQHIYQVIEELLRPSLTNRKLIGFKREES
jgi:hypothetical protein